jgi:hypothetical protein
MVPRRHPVAALARFAVRVMSVRTAGAAQAVCALSAEAPVPAHSWGLARTGRAAPVAAPAKRAARTPAARLPIPSAKQVRPCARLAAVAAPRAAQAIYVSTAGAVSLRPAVLKPRRARSREPHAAPLSPVLARRARAEPAAASVIRAARTTAARHRIPCVKPRRAPAGKPAAWPAAEQVNHVAPIPFQAERPPVRPGSTVRPRVGLAVSRAAWPAVDQVSRVAAPPRAARERACLGASVSRRSVPLLTPAHPAAVLARFVVRATPAPRARAGSVAVPNRCWHVLRPRVHPSVRVPYLLPDSPREQKGGSSTCAGSRARHALRWAASP